MTGREILTTDIYTIDMELTPTDFQTIIGAIEAPKNEATELRIEVAKIQMKYEAAKAKIKDQERMLMQKDEQLTQKDEQLKQVNQHNQYLCERIERLEKENKDLTIKNTSLIWTHIFNMGGLVLAYEKMRKHFNLLKGMHHESCIVDIVYFLKESTMNALRPEEEKLLMNTLPVEDNPRQYRLNFSEGSNCQIVTEQGTAIAKVENMNPTTNP